MIATLIGPHVLVLLAPLITALAMLAVPNLTRRDLLFGVPVPDGFRATKTGRHAVRSYRMTIVAVAVVAAAIFLWIVNPLWMTFAILAMTSACMAAFVAQNRKLQPYALQPARSRVIVLGPPEPLPRFAWLGIVPLAALTGVALYIRAHWDQIPARYPIHFAFDGTPNGWADRTFRGVYGPLIVAVEVSACLFALGLAGWYGSRRSEGLRKPALIVMLGAEWTVAFVFCTIPLKLAAGIDVPVWVIVLAPFLLVVPALVFIVREAKKPRDPIDPTPNECWKGGILYFNPNDAALLVQRRDGIGYTLNMANHWSWIIFGWLLLLVASGPLIVG